LSVNWPEFCVSTIPYGGFGGLKPWGKKKCIIPLTNCPRNLRLHRDKQFIDQEKL